jgi:hypothetical protein
MSHGNEAFPQLILVLQGYGITIDLVGDTFISKAGITSSTFAHVPDAPVSSFELTLPQGKYSALAANGNLCKPTKTVTVKKKVTVKVHGRKRTVTRSVKQTVAEPLTMPTEFVAQNGAELKQDTKIEVEGCSNTLSIRIHSISKQTLIITVGVPAAGKLIATGKGLSKASKTSKGRETVTLKLHATKSGKFVTSVKVTFTPSTGKKQSKTAKVTFKK